MSIFDRLARLARAEFNHVKAVIADRDDDAPADVRDERLERLRRAQEELERAEAALKRAQIDDGAAAWGPGGGDADRGGGASAWGDGAGAGADAWRAEPQARGREATTFTQEIRLAYAALELPLGADRDRVQKAYRAMLSRYHPDKHAHNPELLHAANELTRRVREARDVLLAWLG